MAWTDPTTRSDGDLITATIWNQDIVDNLDWLGAFEAAGVAFSAEQMTDIARVAIGNYTGNASSRTITGVGFTPRLVMVHEETAGKVTFKFWTSDSGSVVLAGSGSLYGTGYITGFTSDGFTLGSSVHTNESGKGYRYIAIG